MRDPACDSSVAGGAVQGPPDVLLPAKVTALCVGVILLAVGLAYSNSFTVPFIFDDLHAIVDNPSLRRLWPVWEALNSPKDSAPAGRPTLSLSLAINYAISGVDPWSYHAGNLLIHVVSALALFGIARRTFLSDRLRERFGSAATGLGLAVALLWAVHPLHSMSVTYVISRGESMMGMFYFLTLYCSIRSYGSTRPLGWYVAAVSACILGMGSKEVMATAPLMVLMYDAVFVTRTWGGALRRRWGFYLSLGATWVFLAILVASGPRNKTVGFHFEEVGPMDYARTMCGVILNYYKLSFWPSPLVFDHHIPWVRTYRECFWEGLAVVSLLLVTAWALWKKPAVGYASAWFFVILGPSTSFLPILTENACEYRMYLPLAGIAGLTVGGVYMASCWVVSRGVASWVAVRWARVGAVALAVTALGATTWERNKDYQSELAIWRDTVEKEPDNPRAWLNFGVALEADGLLDEALHYYRGTIRLDPRTYKAYFNIGEVLQQQEKYAEAAESYREAIRRNPEYPEAHYKLGVALQTLGMNDAAIAECEKAVALRPEYPEALNMLGIAYLTGGNPMGAIERFQAALRAKPDFAHGYDNMGIALHMMGRIKEATEAFRQAVRLGPDRHTSHANLGIALQSDGKHAEAEACFREALRLNPEYPAARTGLQEALRLQGKSDRTLP